MAADTAAALLGVALAHMRIAPVDKRQTDLAHARLPLLLLACQVKSVRGQYVPQQHSVVVKRPNDVAVLGGVVAAADADEDRRQICVGLLRGIMLKGASAWSAKLELIEQDLCPQVGGIGTLPVLLLASCSRTLVRLSSAMRERKHCTYTQTRERA